MFSDIGLPYFTTYFQTCPDLLKLVQARKKIFPFFSHQTLLSFTEFTTKQSHHHIPMAMESPHGVNMATGQTI